MSQNTERFSVTLRFDVYEIVSESLVKGHELEFVETAAGSLGACVAAKRLFELPELGTTSTEPYTADPPR